MKVACISSLCMGLNMEDVGMQATACIPVSLHFFIRLIIPVTVIIVKPTCHWELTTCTCNGAQKLLTDGVSHSRLKTLKFDIGISH